MSLRIRSALLLVPLFAACMGLSQLVAAQHPEAPDFTLPAVANSETPIALADLKGSVTYVDFWASWCGPCRLSLPALDSLYQELSSEGLRVVAISVDVVEEDALDFLKRYSVTYPVAIDTSGNTAKAFAVNGMPSGYLLDKFGRVRAAHVGFKKGDEKKLKQEINALLNEQDHR